METEIDHREFVLDLWCAAVALEFVQQILDIVIVIVIRVGTILHRAAGRATRFIIAIALLALALLAAALHHAAIAQTLAFGRRIVIGIDGIWIRIRSGPLFQPGS